MNIFAVSDLHLSLTAPFDPATPPALAKPMDMFGPAWRDMPRRLAAAWRATVGPEDAVLLPGDLSWAMTLDEAAHDFDYLAALPGRKIIIKGNHDYWWQSLSKVRSALPPGIVALQHDAVAVGGFAVTGTRGWLQDGHADYSAADDEHVYERELLRLQMALDAAAQLTLPILALMHYPPLLTDEDSGFSRLLEQYPVVACLYGHIHGNRRAAFSGTRRGIRYVNCSVDRLGCAPRLIAAGDTLQVEN